MLSWHVDYWDYLGWKDPFGSKEFTGRQRRYQKARKMRQIWTPGFFVDNQPIRSAKRVQPLVEEGHKAKARVTIGAIAKLKDRTVTVVANMKTVGDTPGAEVFAVLWRREATTKCDAGENAGKTLREYFIALEASRPVALGDTMVATFKAPKGLKAADLGVAVLVERPETMETLQCVSVPVTNPAEHR